MTTEVKDRLPDNPLGIEYQRPQQKIVRLSKLQRLYREKPLFYSGLAALLLLSVGTASLKVFAPGSTATVTKQEELPIDTDSILTGSERNLAALKNQSVAQLETYREQLLETKAERFLTEAQKQIDDKTSACFMQSLVCPLNRFQQEAIAQLETARAAGDYDGLLRATDRALVVEYARAAHTYSSEPEHALTQVAIDNLVKGYEQNAAASAEAKAAELTVPQ
ncbi:hypothetical protein [Leptolyngbya sp. BC1307]|uniref:hypothetical protein n=1 Tax=Leptolyngbya sp. BC1307 TaxID=2029589 RepID=UPI000EFC8577|nr:hypothetical protein [Leptolyngbya sp. BC1307]